MMHRPWSSIVEVPYCFSRSNVKFQGHTALKIVKFYRNWAFLDSNSSLNSLMVMKCCTKLETAKERCPIVFQSHPSNFKVTRDKTSPLLTRIGRFRTIGRSQLSNPSDLPCFGTTGGMLALLLHIALSQYTMFSIWGYIIIAQVNVQWHEVNVLDNWQLAVLPQSGGSEFDSHWVHDSFRVSKSFVLYVLSTEAQV